jgi:HD superfamily phosphodiesterase
MNALKEGEIEINNVQFENSLGQIHHAVESIWSPDAPRIIQDYTDHGIMHCKRLRNLADKLLKANGGRPLSEIELYLLQAGIYLHDIGMQCDVVKFEEIKKNAERFGAKFNKKFTAASANSYSIKEQEAIRNNHQYLTASWIDYAYRTGETMLGRAIIVFNLTDYT